MFVVPREADALFVRCVATSLAPLQRWEVERRWKQHYSRFHAAAARRVCAAPGEEVALAGARSVIAERLAHVKYVR